MKCHDIFLTTHSSALSQRALGTLCPLIPLCPLTFQPVSGPLSAPPCLCASFLCFEASRNISPRARGAAQKQLRGCCLGWARRALPGWVSDTQGTHVEIAKLHKPRPFFSLSSAITGSFKVHTFLLLLPQPQRLKSNLLFSCFKERGESLVMLDLRTSQTSRSTSSRAGSSMKPCLWLASLLTACCYIGIADLLPQ